MTQQDIQFAIYDLAAECGWDSRISGASESTASVYIELSRDARSPEDTDESIEEDGPTGDELLIVRVSNHGNAHRRDEEQIHIRIDRDVDADLATLRSRLLQAVKCNWHNGERI